MPQSQVNFHNSARFYQNLLTHSYYSCANFSTLQFGNWHACELPAESRTNTSTRATTIGHQPATRTSTASTTANGYTAHTGQPGENQKGAVEAKKAFRNGGLWSALPDVGSGVGCLVLRMVSTTTAERQHPRCVLCYGRAIRAGGGNR